MRRISAALLAVLIAVLPIHPAAAVRRAGHPVLAYYYIWYTEASWDRAKTDRPNLGRYSSDDPDVMRRHIQAAKSAGITGFIVSWKSTSVLDRRLAMLADVARQESFTLSIIYQALDFHRNPLPVDRVAADLVWFEDRYAADPVFAVYGKPLVIWSGTWKFSLEGITRATEPVRDRLLVLGSEKSAAGYERVASAVDGDAYYWSSVDHYRDSGAAAKLAAMGAAVHRHNGLWIAPFAPGFDARHIGGSRVVGRSDGETLRRQYAAAIASSPDALGLISWNEFSENSHIEPSVRYGDRYLTVLRDITGAPVPSLGPLAEDSSGAGDPGGFPAGPAVAGGAVLLLVILLVLMIRRRSRMVASGTMSRPRS
ncbi:endo-1,3-alpha-glucanase family glycosylhydrolase [Amycolatopsis decaplanina]|uniref:Putative glycosyltransferase n=1 Tax=Amycolatopsis decaplanina DSM 44594 TaxID=1284240 RepID=M2Z359_9PSEU|nr:endo-1,3-alpha-glucanase family glycosylhydrolase [Amycolatopsis decaplanina]EME61682.1 putative glycosyltransferase [Amycolatopsis decaplanina DSM 44594]